MENNYTQVVQPTSEYDQNKEVLSLGTWVITLIIGGIPCLNIIMYLVWAFGNGNENRKNYCRAALILMAVVAVVSMIFGGAIMAAIASAYQY